MRRRSLLSAGAVTAVTVLGGCQFRKSDPETPPFSIVSAETHFLGDGQFVATVELEERDDAEAVAHLRWKVHFESYIQVAEQKFALSPDLGKTVVLHMGAATHISPAEVEQSEVKLIRHEFLDSDWVSAPVQTEENAQSNSPSSSKTV